MGFSSFQPFLISVKDLFLFLGLPDFYYSIKLSSSTCGQKFGFSKRKCQVFGYWDCQVHTS